MQIVHRPPARYSVTVRCSKKAVYPSFIIAFIALCYFVFEAKIFVKNRRHNDNDICQFVSNSKNRGAKNKIVRTGRTQNLTAFLP